MKPKISRLPETVINQIAAGEVVENPASIVKELIENSLDAEAQNICVEIVNGGQQLISVEDDGCGMGPEDALLCLERHATSKIHSAEDLQSLTTMGFRGEALAAIASVSHFELKTSDGTASRVLVEGGVVKAVEPCARNRGTTVEVRSLFYNVPARKKFQKSAAANTAQVTRIVETLSLAHPEAAFTLIVNGKKTIGLKPSKNRIEEVLGKFEHEIKGHCISGYVAAPMKAMATRTGQYLFINRRPIFSPLLSKAVKAGFGTRIGEHAYPPFVLFLEISPESVDINVHPQKKEARFKEEGALFRIVQEAVESAFSPPVAFSEPLSFDPPPAFSFSENVPSYRVAEEAEFPFVFSDRPLAVIKNYLLLQKEQLILVDLAAAKARLLFESLKTEKGLSQALIWPLEIPLDKADEEMVASFNQLGIECRLLNRMLVIDALPPLLEADCFLQFLDSWKIKRRLDLAAGDYCRRIRKEYSIDEAFQIWRRLQSCQDRLYDPLGHPIWSQIGMEDLESILKKGRFD